MTRNDADSRRIVSRRGYLTAAGAAGVAAMAGCAAPDAGGSSAAAQEAETGTETAAEPAPADDWDPMNSTAVETDHPYTSPPEVVDLDERDGQVTLETAAARHQLLGDAAAGGPWELPEVWAFKTADGEPSVPGPILRVTEGTEIELTYDNSGHQRPHTIHVHALDKDWLDDGSPATTGQVVAPGESYTYELTADVTGTHLYHCHFQTQDHMDMGMYGVIHVDPADAEPADVEQFVMLNDWDTRLSASMAGADVDFSHRDRNPDAFTVNGRCAPYSFHPEEGSPLVVSAGDTVRQHVVNAGYTSHTWHTHGHRFEVVEKDGGEVPEAARHEEDVVPLAPGERKTIEYTADADPGIYPMHCHSVDHVMNGDTYPGGMLSAIVYEDAMDTPQFAEAMKKAGFEG